MNIITNKQHYLLSGEYFVKDIFHVEVHLVLIINKYKIRFYLFRFHLLKKIIQLPILISNLRFNQIFSVYVCVLIILNILLLLFLVCWFT